MAKGKGCKALGRALRERRLELGLSQRQVSDRLRQLFDTDDGPQGRVLSATRISEYERGDIAVPLVNLKSLLSALQCDLVNVQIYDREAEPKRVCRVAEKGEGGFQVAATTNQLSIELKDGRPSWPVLVVHR